MRLYVRLEEGLAEDLEDLDDLDDLEDLDVLVRLFEVVEEGSPVAERMIME